MMALKTQKSEENNREHSIETKGRCRRDIDEVKNNNKHQKKINTNEVVRNLGSHKLCAHHIIIIKKFHFHFNRHNINFVAFRFNKFIWVSVRCSVLVLVGCFPCAVRLLSCLAFGSNRLMTVHTLGLLLLSLSPSLKYKYILYKSCC